MAKKSPDEHADEFGASLVVSFVFGVMGGSGAGLYTCFAEMSDQMAPRFMVCTALMFSAIGFILAARHYSRSESTEEPTSQVPQKEHIDEWV